MAFLLQRIRRTDRLILVSVIVFAFYIMHITFLFKHYL